ncbi:BTAD domain-containing putative transcriptional regulator [Streptomyces lateritius]|uniref:AfsR/SARP family transcriptional regulator n=1 Tax=Streptomyces lateritius TaxID=67313 RepID=UPI0021AB95D1|nr:BTAD domain-containing putative transcriptional regulator [Streptomyces lateritius]
MRARRGNSPLALGPVRRQAVLASLLLRAPAFVTYQQLLDDVWGDEPPGTGHRVLPSYVYALRKALDEPSAAAELSVVRGGRGGYRLAADGVRTDLAELAEEAASARRAKAAGDLDAALAHGSRALELLHGEPLPGLPGPFAEARRQRLGQQRRALHLDRAECLVLLGRCPDALDTLLAAPATQEYDEPFAALHMRALYGSGRQAEALSVYRETRRRLVDELGLEPGEELRRVHQALLHRDDPLLLGRTGRTRAATTVAAERTGSRDSAPGPPVPDGSGLSGEPDDLHDRLRPPTRRNDLPGNTACLVGRETELALLTAPVAPGAVSVMTVYGTAGVGKTALVVRAAWSIADAHPDGCLFVDLHAYGAAHERVAPQRALRRMLRAVLDEGDALPTPPPRAHTPAGDDDMDDLTDLITACVPLRARCGCSWSSTTRAAPSRCGRCFPPDRAAGSWWRDGSA